MSILPDRGLVGQSSYLPDCQIKLMTMEVEVCKSACPDPGSIPGVSTIYKYHIPWVIVLSSTVIIAILAVVVVYLLMLAQKERRKSSTSKNRVKNRAWRREGSRSDTP